MDYENQLATEIDRQLKNLPELRAPASLSRRVLAAIAQCVPIPWYRRAWQTWPVPLQIASMTLLLAMFGGVCYAAWQLEQMRGLDILTQEITTFLSPVFVVCNAVIAVLGAVVSLVKKLGTITLVGCFAALALGWGVCLALGTACVRLALAKR